MAGGAWLSLIGLSLAMLGGSFLAGSLPLWMKLSDRNVQFCSTFGAGLLVGTALAVIIPEGMHTLYDAQQPAYMATELAGETQPQLKDHCEASMHSYVGVTLVLGFVFQLLVDKMAFSSGRHRPFTGTEPLSVSSPRPDKLAAATIGLVIHSAADGIALGAASAASQPSLEALVFLAIMLHKAPAAFGLTSFLLAEGLDNKRIRQHLGAFALAAPAMALFTYGVIQAQSTSAEPQLAEGSPVTGLALLFSAGTFLYVATVHVLPEVVSTNGTGDGSKELTRTQLLVLVAGCTLPVLLSLSHHH